MARLRQLKVATKYVARKLKGKLFSIVVMKGFQKCRVEEGISISKTLTFLVVQSMAKESCQFLPRVPFLALEFPLPVKLAELDDKFIRHMKYAFGIALIGSSRLEILSFIFESEKALLSTRIVYDTMQYMQYSSAKQRQLFVAMIYDVN